MSKTVLIADSPEGLFTPEEFRILEHWFEHGNDSDDSGRLRRDIEQLDLGDISSPSAAVAAIVLRCIQHTLPRWIGRSEDGQIVYGRKFYLPKSQRKLLLKPRWVHGASGFGAGPGMGWKVSYHVVWVPIFDRFVVTESSDDAGCSDSADHAIGHFQSDLPHDAGQVDAILEPYRARLAEMARENELDEGWEGEGLKSR